jgi:cell division protein FtsB
VYHAQAQYQEQQQRLAELEAKVKDLEDERAWQLEGGSARVHFILTGLRSGDAMADWNVCPAEQAAVEQELEALRGLVAVKDERIKGLQQRHERQAAR